MGFAACRWGTAERCPAPCPGRRPLEITHPDDTARPVEPVGQWSGMCVTLADGALEDLSTLDRPRLVRLQWEQERAFARQILDAPKGSPQRAEATRRAYDTVTRIFAAVAGFADQPVVMGLRPRYARLLQTLLVRQQRRGICPAFFEIGYGSGGLLKRVAQWGFPAAGIEVSETMYRQACRQLGPSRQADLHRGEFLGYRFPDPEARHSLIYWNDVFEHIPPDEISACLEKIHRLLVPGGQLVTITPNWHMRPSDITGDVCPPRTEAMGLHLKEYTLREVRGLLRRAGFTRVATPLVVVPGRIVLCGSGLVGLKCLLEPGLERLPVRLAELLCRGFGLSETIATRGS